MKKTIASIFVSAVALVNAYGNDVKEEIQEDVSFYLSFDGSIEVDRSVVEGQAINFAEIKNQVFTNGISGKALVAKEKRIVMLFKRKDILDFGTAGSISMWIKPEKWLNAKDMPVDEETGFRKVLYQNFFLTSYSPNGYIGFERVTSPHADHRSRMLLYFAKFKDIKAKYTTRIDWSLKESKWYNVVITWSPLSFKVYFDGKFKGETTLQKSIKDEELNENFRIECPAGTMIDEFIIYKKALSEEEVVKFYNAYSKEKTK